jgi:hypothetical protein
MRSVDRSLTISGRLLMQIKPAGIVFGPGKEGYCAGPLKAASPTIG